MWVRKVYGCVCKGMYKKPLADQGGCAQEAVCRLQKVCRVCVGVHMSCSMGQGECVGVSHVLGRIHRDAQKLHLGYARECRKCRRYAIV